MRHEEGCQIRSHALQDIMMTDLRDSGALYPAEQIDKVLVFRATGDGDPFGLFTGIIRTKGSLVAKIKCELGHFVPRGKIRVWVFLRCRKAVAWPGGASVRPGVFFAGLEV